MAPKSIGKGKDSYQQAPPGIQDKDWANTPISVRKFVIALLEVKQSSVRNPENRFPLLVTLLINLLLVIGITNYLEGRVTVPCITPHMVSPLSVAIISLIPLHLIWRNIYTFIPPNFEETIKIGFVTVPLTFLFIFFNEMQIWKIPSRLFGLLLLALLAVGAYLNLSPNSPFYEEDELSAIQGFSIQRFDKKLAEGLPVGGTLTIKANEKVLVEVVFRGETERPCIWYSRMSSSTVQAGCSIVLDEVSRTGRDTLTVKTQSACGTQDFVGLHVVVLPE